MHMVYYHSGLKNTGIKQRNPKVLAGFFRHALLAP